MSVVNFSVTDALEQKINKIIEKWGFNSKAEFFRFLAIDFISKHESTFELDDETRQLSKQLGHLLKAKLDPKKMRSIDQQLEDLL